MPEYLELLAKRAIRAWSEKSKWSADKVEDLLQGGQLDFKRHEEKSGGKALSGSKLRDIWQERIFRALEPSKGKETKEETKQGDRGLRAQSEKIAKSAARISLLLDEKGQQEFKSHFKDDLPTSFSEDGWHKFMMGVDPPKGEDSDSAKTQLPPALGRLAKTTDFVKSTAPVLARRIAADLTQQQRVLDIFEKYGFPTKVADRERPDAELKEKLTAELHERLKDKVVPEGLKKKFKDWPAAAVRGSFAQELASELDYMPSTWALEGELRCVSDRRVAREQNKIAQPEHESPKDKAWKANLLGLAFSGGGIRSATFNLGILQGLAKVEMLRKFDYLSTVSGGGYIGSWFINWIKGTDFDNVERRLCPDATPDPADPRVAPIRFLRDFSNYLTPRMGLLSADLWVMGVVWFRNTLLNLLVLLPTLLAVLFVPRLPELWAHTVGITEASSPVLPSAYLVLLLLFVVCAVLFLVLNLREFPIDAGDPEAKTGPRKQHYYLRPQGVMTLIVFPVFAAAWFAALELWSYAGSSGSWKKWVFLGSVGVALWILWGARYRGNFRRIHPGWRNFAEVAMVLIALATGAVTILIVGGLEKIFVLWPHTLRVSNICSSSPVMVFGVPLVVGTLFFVLILMVGFMGTNLPDNASTWLARLRAYIAIYSTVWLAWVGISVYGSWVDYHLRSVWYAKWPVIAVWLWTTLRGVLAGKDPGTEGGKSDWKTSLGFYATVGPYVFILGLLLMLSLGAQWSLMAMEEYLAGAPSQYCLLRWLQAACASHPWSWALLICLSLSASLGAIMSVCVDINTFSLSNFYRGRLVRAYLGAANTKRHPNLFTGFDSADDTWALASFQKSGVAGEKRSPEPYSGPFPIYNATVNLVHGDELAWQERKGASFTFTPELCGYETPWNAESSPRTFKNLDFSGYRETLQYAYQPHGMHLGVPMSISGAALSPNMGSYTRAATGFMMTVFNARLGAWLGNPRHNNTWCKSGPASGLAYLMKELLGLTNDRAGFVYLSDGGHFENLAIYELVRRRCRFIVACDAEEDPGFGFDGLGNAIRKCREDFGVEIDLGIDLLKPDAATHLSHSHCVVGTIQYPDQAASGYLVYMKASIVGDEPEDVLQYRVKCPVFPHQSTGDQWFTESQFESYRRLGLHIAETTFERAVGDMKDKDTVDNEGYTEALFEELRDDWYPPNEAIRKNFTKHAQAFDKLVREMRSDAVLMKLDNVLIPIRGAQSPVIDDPLEQKKVFLFLSSMIQLMENVYIDLELEANADHPHCAGWIEIFQTWAQDEIFKTAWGRYGWTYGSNFRRFCHRRFGLPEVSN
jgi:hypothetical protein